MNISSGVNRDEGLRWLVLDLNSFFASCEQQEDSALREQPVAIVPVMAETTCAIAASYTAKAFGIRTGTPVWEARQLCPSLKIVLARPKLYVEYHHRILKAIETCLPIEEVMSIDEVACRLDCTQQTPVAATLLAKQIKAAILAQAGECLTSSIGIAANKLLAKLASNMQKPDGLTLLRHADMPHAILRLPLNALPGVGHNMYARLQEAGIADMKALWNADAQYLRRIWSGVTGLRFHMLLHGGDVVSPSHPKRSISHQHVLAPDLRDMCRAAPVIRQLLIRAAQRLRVEGVYCRRLSLDIKWAAHKGYYVREAEFHETQDTTFLLNMLQSLWHGAPLLKPKRIGICLGGFVPENRHQADLFDRPKPEQLMAAIDRLNAKFGRATVTYGATIPSLVSKIAFQRVPRLNEF